MDDSVFDHPTIVWFVYFFTIVVMNVINFTFNAYSVYPLYYSYFVYCLSPLVGIAMGSLLVGCYSEYLDKRGWR